MSIDWEAIYEKHKDDEPFDDTLKCDECGETIQPFDGYYDIEGQIYCEDCILNFHKINR